MMRKPRALPPPKEIDLHRPLAGLLRLCVRQDWRWTHFPAGELRDKRTAAKLREMGLQCGWPDFILVDPRALFHGLELKRPGEDLTGEQPEFAAWCAQAGAPYAVASTIDEALAVLSRWGALRVSLSTGAQQFGSVPSHVIRMGDAGGCGGKHP